MIRNSPNFFHLNIGDSWPNFDLTDLEIAADGALQLRALPRLIGDVPESVSGLRVPLAPAGIARADDGTLFFTEPDGHRLWKIDHCDAGKKAQIVACIGGEGSDATQFKYPRGLLLLPRRGLLVADSGNNRIQIIDPATSRVLEIWNGVDSKGGHLLHQPWTMASDSEEDIYVLVYGDHSLQKLDRFGRIDPWFRQNVNAVPKLYDPTALAIATIDGQEHVLVVDRSHRALVVFDREGHWRKTFNIEDSQTPFALAASKRAIYIGDNGDQERKPRVLQFDVPALDDPCLRFVGAAVGYSGPIAALHVDRTRAEECCDAHDEVCPNAAEPRDLLLLPGGGHAPLVLKEGAGYRDCGFAIAGPFDFRRRPVTWHRLKAFAETLRAHDHIRFFFTLSESRAKLPPAVRQRPELCGPVDEMFKNWCAFPVDAAEGIFESFVTQESLRTRPPNPMDAVSAKANRSRATSTYLWLGVGLAGDGGSTPRIRQIRVEFDYASYLPYLPAVYSEDRETRQFLLPMVSLFESFFDEQERAIAGLPALFDPESAESEFLDWLAGWLAQDVEEGWSDERKRRMIAEAFAAYAKRGTAAGLRRRLQTYAGIEAHVLEPIAESDLWSLGASSTLSFDTRLAAAEAQGAVVGSSATLDHSYLITEAEFGAPLFEELAHQFSVVVYPNAVNSPQRMARLRSVIERDKPAHTDYHICIVQPQMRVGFQSTLGLDTVVGGPATATPLADEPGIGLVLAGTPPANLGEGSQVGANILL